MNLVASTVWKSFPLRGESRILFSVVGKASFWNSVCDEKKNFELGIHQDEQSKDGQKRPQPFCVLAAVFAFTARDDVEFA